MMLYLMSDLLKSWCGVGMWKKDVVDATEAVKELRGMQDVGGGVNH